MTTINYRILICFALLLMPLVASAQTYISSATQTAPLTYGEYYNDNSITLGNGFSFTAQPGQSLHLFIKSTCVPLAAQPTQTLNYIITYTPRKEGIVNPAGAGIATCDVMETIQYFDDLGRPLQTVQVKGNPKADKDIVQPVAYDAYGREPLKYLPYTTDGTPGSYRANALTGAQTTFYQQSSDYPVIPSPYAGTAFEASPLNRITEQGAPGNPWQLAGSGVTGAGHTIKSEYTANTTSSGDYSARFYTADEPTLPANTGVFSTVFDETRSRVLNSTGYYNANELYVTITKDENWQATDGLAGTIQQYTDKEGHVVLKRTFNKKADNTLETLSTYYVYDNIGNLSFVLPPGLNPDAGGLTPTQLDAFGYQYRYDREQRLSEKRLPGKGWEEVISNINGQVMYSRDARQSQNNQWSWFTYDAIGRLAKSGVYDGSYGISSQDIRMGYDYVDGDGIGIDHSYISDPASPGCKLLTVNYYDNYDFINNNSINPDAAVFTAPNSIAGQISNPTGLPTATQTNILGTNTMLLTVSYYDDKGRIAQSKSRNHLGGNDITTNSYSFTDELLTSTRQHTGTLGNAVTVATHYTYDHMGRKLQSWQKMDSGTDVLVSSLEYNEIGQLKTRQLGNGLQTINYTYNERGWLTTTSAALFAMQLKYNDGTTPQFNGNIANQLWGTPGNLNKAFTYTYDRLNRLTSGTSLAGNNESDIVYDVMGNLKALNRSGTGAANLGYNYTSGNQLASVTNGGNPYRSYGYDVNGNATTDGLNNTINYNQLNLPATIPGKGLTYTYTATGQKLKKVSVQGSTTTTTDYAGGIQYNNNAIDFVQTEAGRALKVGSTWNYEYTLTDHLGNNRVTFDQTSGTTPKETSDYYPFGLQIAGGLVSSPTNKYLYNNKEIQEELGQYDYGARFYDPVIGRWTSIDPLAEKHVDLSPMTYVFNNPVKTIDPDGKDGIVSIKGNTITISTSIYVYGKNATAATASQIQNNIMGAWSKQSNGQGWQYTDAETNKVYNVKFNVSVQLYDGKEKQDPLIIGDEFNPFSRNNYIELDDGTKRSHVTKGDIGLWDPNDNWAMGHEWGHLVGLGDKYSDVGDHSEAWNGWQGNIMGEYGGAVGQKNINGIIAGSMESYNKARKAAETFNQMRQQAINKGYGQTVGAKHSVPGDDYEYETSINSINPNN
jgi:RHS repeat-associated protein